MVSPSDQLRATTSKEFLGSRTNANSSTAADVLSHGNAT